MKKILIFPLVILCVLLFLRLLPNCQFVNLNSKFPPETGRDELAQYLVDNEFNYHIRKNESWSSYVLHGAWIGDEKPIAAGYKEIRADLPPIAYKLNQEEIDSTCRQENCGILYAIKSDPFFFSLLSHKYEVVWTLCGNNEKTCSTGVNLNRLYLMNK